MPSLRIVVHVCHAPEVLADARLHADLMDTHRDIDVHEAERGGIQRLQFQLDCRVARHLQLLLSLAVNHHARFYFLTIAHPR